MSLKKALSFQETKIIDALAISTAATHEEIEYVYNLFKSWDETIKIINISVNMGRSIDDVVYMASKFIPKNKPIG